MRKTLFASSVFILLSVLVGCQHRRVEIVLQPPPPQPKQKPLPTPHTTLADMPVIPEAAPPTVVLGGAVAPPEERHEWRPKDNRPASSDQANKPAATPNAAAGEELPNTTPIGELSAAPNTKGLPTSPNIANEIKWIQGQLQQIHHTLTPKEQRTTTAIRAFLLKAQNALQAGDLDGANNLTTKARVLLSELQ